jgi:hypothetical protein
VERKTGTKRTTLPTAKPSPTRRVAGGKKAVGPVAKVAAKMEQDSKAKTAAIKAGKLTKKERGNGSGPHTRLTTEWTGKDKKDVQVKDKVKLADGTVITCVGRWTKRTKTGNVPFITGTTADGTRKNSAASEVTHTK